MESRNGGLSFLDIMIGMIIGIICTIPANLHYTKVQSQRGGYAPPETRLIMCMPGVPAIPISQFWFAWTNYTSIHWIVCIIGSAPFGMGSFLIYMGCVNYLIDSYTIYAASVLAANAVLRSIFGAALPIVSTLMYDGVGTHWALSIPAFITLLFLPFPFFFYKYGAAVRAKCKYAVESDQYMKKLAENIIEEKKKRASTAEPVASHEIPTMAMERVATVQSI